MEGLKNKELEKKSLSLVDESREITVKEGDKYILKGEEQRDIAAIYLKEASSLEKAIKEHYAPIEKAHRETGKVIKTAKESQLVEVTLAKTILSQALGEFDAKKRREAEEKARIERERIEKERLAEAARLEESGNKEEAQAILDMPEPEVITEQPEKLSGIRQMKYIKSELEDEEACVTFLIKKITEGDTEFKRFLRADMSGIREYIKFHDGNFRFPGVKTWVEYKASSTGR